MTERTRFPQTCLVCGRPSECYRLKRYGSEVLMCRECLEWARDELADIEAEEAGR